MSTHHRLVEALQNTTKNKSMPPTDNKAKLPEIKSTSPTAAQIQEEYTSTTPPVKTPLEIEHERLSKMNTRPIPIDRVEKIGSHYFCVRIDEEYICNKDGTLITPYFGQAWQFDSEKDARSIGRKTGGQLLWASKNHKTAKRIITDYSPIY